MKIPWYWIFSIVLMLVTAVILAGLESSLWFLVFGAFPPPMLWMIVLVYTVVTRPLWEATMMTYLLCLVNSAFTIFPFEALLVYCLILMVSLILVRERVFWGGPTYFMLIVGVASVAAPVLFWFTSRWFDKNPVFVPEIFDWIISALLTMLFSFPVYRIYQWFDRVGTWDAGSESRVGPR